jgi:hypothetical protein
MTEEEAIAAGRGSQAHREYTELEAAFEQVRSGLFEAFANSAIADKEVREAVYSAIHVLDKVRSILLEVASGQQMVQHADLIRSILAGNDPG